MPTEKKKEEEKERQRERAKKKKKVKNTLFCKERARFSFFVLIHKRMPCFVFYNLSHERNGRERRERKKKKEPERRRSKRAVLSLFFLPRSRSALPRGGPVVRRDHLAHLEEPAAVGVIDPEQQVDLPGQHPHPGPRDGGGELLLAQLGVSPAAAL